MNIQVGKLEGNIPGKAVLYKGRAVPFWIQFSCSVATTQHTAGAEAGSNSGHIPREDCGPPRTPNTPQLFLGTLHCKTLGAPQCCIRYKEFPP